MDKIKALRQALDLGYEDDVFPTEDQNVYIVERKKVAGLYGFCNSIPEEKLEIYLVLDNNEAEKLERSLLEADHVIDGIYIFKT